MQICLALCGWCIAESFLLNVVDEFLGFSMCRAVVLHESFLLDAVLRFRPFFC